MLEVFVLWVFTWIVCAVAVAFAARARGRSGLAWFAVAVLLSPLLGFVLLALYPSLAGRPNDITHRKCPVCYEWTNPLATKCPHCHSAIEARPLAG